jgi:hypothetical protein
MARIHEILKDSKDTIKEVSTVEMVRRYENAYASNAAGMVIALSYTLNKVSELVLGAESAELEYLYLSDNKNLKTLVFEVSMPKLTHLNLSDTGIEGLIIPSGCVALEQLYVQNTGLSKIEFRGNCLKLELLDCANNKLAFFEVPEGFGKLRFLYLEGENNRISNVRGIEGLVNSCEKVMSHYRAIHQSGSVLNNEAKLIFFGNGRAGKTTISHQLRMGKLKSFDLTHGILTYPWEIDRAKYSKGGLLQKFEAEWHKLSEKEKEKCNIPDNIILHLWDFGGQDYFHATHRLFLTDNVLYLVVWEEETERQDESNGNYPLPYWKRNIEHYAPKNIKLIVKNKEESIYPLDPAKGVYKVAKIKDKVLPLNNVDAPKSESYKAYLKDIAILEGVIIEKLPQLNWLGKPIAKLWDEIRKELRRLGSTEPYLSFVEYQKLCYDFDKTDGQILHNENDFKELVQFLIETGVITCFRYDYRYKMSALTDYVFIDSKWLTTSIYQILNDDVKANNGVFTKKEVIQALKKNGNALLDEKTWIELMEKFELIFLVKGSNDHYIAPQFLGAMGAGLVGRVENDEKDLVHRIELFYPDFLPKSTINRLMCKRGGGDADYWKDNIIIDANGERVWVSCLYPQRRLVIRSKNHLSKLTVAVLDELREIDKADKMEIAISNPNQFDKLIGFIGYDNLRTNVGYGNIAIEYRGERYDTKPFFPLFNSENLGGRSENGKDLSDSVPNEVEDKLEIGEGDFLFLATNSKAAELNLNGEFDAIQKGLRIKNPDFNISKTEMDATLSKIIGKIGNGQMPKIIHFCGHANEEGVLIKDRRGDVLPLSLATIEEVLLLEGGGKKPQLILFNGCHTGKLAKRLSEKGFYVVGYDGAILDAGAIEFAASFYEELAKNGSVVKAYRLGVIHLGHKCNTERGKVELYKGGVQIPSR